MQADAFDSISRNWVPALSRGSRRRRFVKWTGNMRQVFVVSWKFHATSVVFALEDEVCGEWFGLFGRGCQSRGKR